MSGTLRLQRWLVSLALFAPLALYRTDSAPGPLGQLANPDRVPIEPPTRLGLEPQRVAGEALRYRWTLLRYRWTLIYARMTLCENGPDSVSPDDAAGRRIPELPGLLSARLTDEQATLTTSATGFGRDAVRPVCAADLLGYPGPSRDSPGPSGAIWSPATPPTRSSTGRCET